MVHSEFPDTLDIYPTTYIQYEYTDPGLDAGETAVLYMQNYLTVPEFLNGFDGEQYTFYIMVDSYIDYCVEPGRNYNNVK